MLISYAPLVHARTANVDFRREFLVVPEDFKKSEIEWAHDFVTASTRYFELVSPNGRRLLFFNDEYLVTGISIFIRDLYHLCNQEPKYATVDGNRSNYAFIGLVFKRDEIKRPFQIPFSVYLLEYEKIMNKRWNETLTDSALNNTTEPYVIFDFPECHNALTASLSDHTEKTILCSKDIDRESFIAGLMLRKESSLAFCSDMPNATSIIESNFNIVTTENPDTIKLTAFDKKEKSVSENFSQIKTTGEVSNLHEHKRKDNLKDIILWTIIGMSIFSSAIIHSYAKTSFFKAATIVCIVVAFVCGVIKAFRIYFRNK